MKKYLLLIAIVAGGWSFAQAQKLDLGEEYSEDPEAILSFPQIVGGDATGYYIAHRKLATNFGIGTAFAMNNNKVYLRKFMKDLNLEKSVQIKLNNPEVSENFEEIFMLRNKLFLFSSSTNSKNKTSELFFREVDKSTLDIPSTGKSLGKISYESSAKSSFVSHNFKISRDSSKLLVYSQLPSEKDKPKRFMVQTYTHGLDKLWAREIELPYIEDIFWSPTFLIDNEGRVFALGKFYPKDAKGRPEENPQFKILVLEATKESSSEMSVNSGDKILENLYLEVLNNGDLIGVGAFSEKKPSKVNGFYVLKINPATKAILKENYIEITANMVQEGSGESDTKNAKSENEPFPVRHYDFPDIAAKSDGGVILVGEHQMKGSIPGGSSSGSRFTYYDIIVLNISGEGELENFFLIRKKQDMYHSNMYLSYGLMIVESKIYLIFNDRVENLNLAVGEQPTLYIPGGLTQNKQVIELVSVNTEGKGGYTRKALTTAKTTEIIAIPAITHQLTPHEALIVFEKKDRRRLGRISF